MPESSGYHRGGPAFNGGKGPTGKGKAPALGKGPGPHQYTINGRPMVGGKGILNGAHRHRKIQRDTIYGVTKGDIRRLARRGGIKRISAPIYDEVRNALKERLTGIIQDCVTYVEYRNAKTVTILDVIQALKRLGKPIVGFDPDTYTPPEKRK